MEIQNMAIKRLTHMFGVLFIVLIQLFVLNERVYCAALNPITVVVIVAKVLPGGIPKSIIKTNMGDLCSYQRLSHYPQLASIDNYSSSPNKKSTEFHYYFPYWCLIGATGGFFFTGLGWWNLRTERRVEFGFLVFSIGLSLWGYSIYFGIMWWFST